MRGPVCSHPASSIWTHCEIAQRQLLWESLRKYVARPSWPATNLSLTACHKLWLTPHPLQRRVVTRQKESGGCGVSLGVTLPYMGQRGQAFSPYASMLGDEDRGVCVGAMAGFTCLKVLPMHCTNRLEFQLGSGEMCACTVRSARTSEPLWPFESSFHYQLPLAAAAFRESAHWNLS